MSRHLIMKHKSFAFAFFFSTLATVNFAWARPPRIVASIYPVALLVSEIGSGIVKPEVLVPPGQSPHTFSLKPSNIISLKKANLIIRVSPSLEVFLNKMLAHRPALNTMTLALIKGLQLIIAGDPSHPREAKCNPHLWLSPYNAKIMAIAIAKQLIALDPKHEKGYLANLKRFKQRLELVDESIKKRISKLRGKKNLFVYHNAWQYLTDYYHLRIVDTFVAYPEQAVSAQHTYSLHKRMQLAKTGCLLYEPQFRSPVAQKITQGLHLKTAVIDPLGARIPLGANSYTQFLRSTMGRIIQCLQSSPARN